MKRLSILFLSLLLACVCAGCVGQAAPDAAEPPSDPPVEADPGPAAADPPESTPQPEPASLAETDPVDMPPLEELYVRTIDPSLPMVALTFDDGPHATCTDQILDILEENHAVATFFEVGRNVAACPAPLTRMAELGCEIASHSNAHKDLSKLRKSALIKDLDTADAAFIAAVGVAPTLVRPPYGAVNKTVKYESGRTMITWTLDTLDWESRNAQSVINSVQQVADLDGEIVLMHSLYESTVEAVAVLVPWLQEQGYQLVTVTELMAYYYGELPQPNQFYGYTYFTTHGRTDTPLDLPSSVPSVEGTSGPESSAEAPAETAPTPAEAVPVAVQTPAPQTPAPAPQDPAPAAAALSVPETAPAPAPVEAPVEPAPEPVPDPAPDPIPAVAASPAPADPVQEPVQETPVPVETPAEPVPADPAPMVEPTPAADPAPAAEPAPAEVPTPAAPADQPADLPAVEPAVSEPPEWLIPS